MTNYSDQKLLENLLELEIISSDQLKNSFELSKNSSKSFRQSLVESGLIAENDLNKLVADQIGIPAIDLTQEKIDQEVLHTIPEIVARKQQVIAFRKDKYGLHLAMLNPANIQIADFVGKKTGLDIQKYLVSQSDFEDALTLYSEDVEKIFKDIIDENIDQAKENKNSEPPIIKIVDTIIKYAYQNKASDIHLEPLEENTLVRFRIDGVLHDVVKLPLELHEQIVMRIKILSKLRTDEHQQAQDGKMQVKLESNELDIRVSIVPITNGEKVVMRLLAEKSRRFSLKDLGLEGEDLEKLTKAYQRPHGMILVTGPTGSGKTTTLYSVLKILNKKDINIMTIEDPVEYDIERINQIQVNPKTELTFAKGLRSIVRQDPDIILVGEIRDQETANIAINAAMTGHLVLSTLHTNDAATTIPRLIDMGVEPYLVSSTVNVIIAQRLVRKICQNCRTSIELTAKELEKYPLINQETIDKYFSKEKTNRIYQGKGCEVCHMSGYTGRIGIFETLIMDDQIKESVVEEKDAGVIKELAILNGMKTMFDDGIEKVKQGVTTLEEVYRVTKE